MSLESEFGFIPQWRRRAFPGQGPLGAFTKLEDEIIEWIDAGGGDGEVEELADIFITLVNYVDLLCGLGAFDAAIREKMRVNMERTWEVDENGRGQHVE